MCAASSVTDVAPSCSYSRIRAFQKVKGDYAMCIRKSLLAVFTVAIVAGVYIAGVRVAAAASSTFTNTNYMTFNGPVALPGVTLPAGTYSFRTADQDRNVVQVLNRAETKSYYMGVTRPVLRPRGDRQKPLVIFGEAPRGRVQPIQAWCPADQEQGHAFIYDR